MTYRHCAISGQQFEISPQTHKICDLLQVPLPEIGFEEAMRRQMCCRNLLFLYRRKSDKSGRSMISIFPQDSPFTVFHQEEWFDPGWDALEFGRDYELSRPFFEQFGELLKVVPLWGLQNVNTENAEYCTSISNSANCYLAFGCYYSSEDVFCSYRVHGGKAIYYSLYVDKSELCFYCLRTRHCYSLICCEECLGCSDCAFCYELIGCSDCLFSSNLRNKRFYIHNKQYSEHEYRRIRTELDLGSQKTFERSLRDFEELKKQSAHRATIVVNSEDSTGHHVVNSKSCRNCFEVEDSERLEDCISVTGSQTLVRIFGATDGDFSYDSTGLMGSHCAFTIWCYHSYDCQYSVNLHNCKHCFGCSGLRNKEYCILNKELGKEAYDKLRTRIIEQMKTTPLLCPDLKRPLVEYGNFFPPELALTEYNMSHANLFYPLSEEQAVRRGFRWRKEETVAQSRATHNEFRHIRDLAGIDERIICQRTGKEFLPPQRMLEKFMQLNVWLIQEHPTEYLKSALAAMNYKLIKRRSAKSGNEILSVHPEQSAPIVLSNDEYTAQFA